MCVQCLSPAVSRSSSYKGKHKHPLRTAAAAHMMVADRVVHSSVVREHASADQPWAAFQQALSNWLVVGRTWAKLHRSKATVAEQPSCDVRYLRAATKANSLLILT